MGWVKERQDGNGKVRYTAVYLDLQGRERSAGTWSTKKRAIAEWHGAEKALATGRIGDPARGRQSLAYYVEHEWFPNHVLEATSRENYRYTLDLYILPELGNYKMAELLPAHVREWIGVLQSSKYKANPPTIQKAKLILDAILTTAMNDQITSWHAGRGVKTPPIAKKPRRILTAEHYDRIYRALADDTMRLLVETDIESGLRWGELTELRVGDIDYETGIVTISRAVVELKAKDRPGGKRFVVKNYPKDEEWRSFGLAPHLVAKIQNHVARLGLAPGDLLFELHQPAESRRRTLPETMKDPETLGFTEPNEKGRAYRHGTTSAYGAGRCRCRDCKNAVAAYRAARRAEGKDHPTRPRRVDTDGHIGNNWFRNNIWIKALEKAELGFHVTPHGLRHAHASWLLAGGADIRIVMERLGHGSITTTEKYLHTMPNADQAAMDALDAIRGNRIIDNATSEALQQGNGEQACDERDSELAELRATVAKFKDILGSLSAAK